MASDVMARSTLGSVCAISLAAMLAGCSVSVTLGRGGDSDLPDEATGGSDDPTETTGSTDPTDATESTDPTGSTSTTEPTDWTTPVDPTGYGCEEVAALAGQCDDEVGESELCTALWEIAETCEVLDCDVALQVGELVGWCLDVDPDLGLCADMDALGAICDDATYSTYTSTETYGGTDTEGETYTWTYPEGEDPGAEAPNGDGDACTVDCDIVIEDGGWGCSTAGTASGAAALLVAGALARRRR